MKWMNSCILSGSWFLSIRKTVRRLSMAHSALSTARRRRTTEVLTVLPGVLRFSKCFGGVLSADDRHDFDSFPVKPIVNAVYAAHATPVAFADIINGRIQKRLFS